MAWELFAADVIGEILVLVQIWNVPVLLNFILTKNYKKLKLSMRSSTNNNQDIPQKASYIFEVL